MFASRRGCGHRISAPTDYVSQVRPIVERYCIECHAADVIEADVDLGALATTQDARSA